MRIGSISVVVGWVCLGAIVAAGGSDAHPLTPISLQQLIDTTPAGGTLDLPPGFYVGPARIDRPMTLRGGDGVILDGRGRGTVLSIEADDVTVTGLLVRNSGDRNDGIDAALRLAARRAVIEDNTIEDCL